MARPLAGVRVLDLTRLLPGPYATLVLADLGADVVKVEDPGTGDYLRGISPGMFAALNRGKRSVALDLRTDAARFRELCARADVLVEGFRPGVFEKNGIDVAAEFPRLVMVRLSGFGQTGPWREIAGHDIGYVALAGTLARAGALPGVQIADFVGGFQIATAVLAGLYERASTGRGRVIDVSMAEAAMQLVMPALAATGEPNILDGSRPAYRVYRCKDARRYALGALEPKFWSRFCAAVSRPEWEPRAFDEGLTGELDALFATRTRDEWDRELRPVDCCGEPVVELDELERHPQHVARGMFVAPGLMRTTPALAPASELSSRSAPALGQDTAEVFADWVKRTA